MARSDFRLELHVMLWQGLRVRLGAGAVKYMHWMSVSVYRKVAASSGNLSLAFACVLRSRNVLCGCPRAPCALALGATQQLATASDSRARPPDKYWEHTLCAGSLGGHPDAVHMMLSVLEVGRAHCRSAARPQLTPRRTRMFAYH